MPFCGNTSRLITSGKLRYVSTVFSMNVDNAENSKKKKSIKLLWTGVKSDFFPVSFESIFFWYMNVFYHVLLLYILTLL